MQELYKVIDKAKKTAPIPTIAVMTYLVTQNLVIRNQFKREDLETTLDKIDYSIENFYTLFYNGDYEGMVEMLGQIKEMYISLEHQMLRPPKKPKPKLELVINR